MFEDLHSATHARDLARDREIAARFAPVFYQALGAAPRFDYLTKFDFDGDWRGDNNWGNAGNRVYSLTGYVYYAVFETETHFFVHYAVFHPRDYKGGEHYGVLLSNALQAAVRVIGPYDPTGRSHEAVMSHENDLEGVLVVAEKAGKLADARVVIVETLAHNELLKYAPAGGPFPGEPVRMERGHPVLQIESAGHGITASRPNDRSNTAENGFLVYRFTGSADDPEKLHKDFAGYDLLPILDTLWVRAQSGSNETWGEERNYGIVKVRFAGAGGPVWHDVRLGVIGSAFRGLVGGANMARPPWGWFYGGDRNGVPGEWFFKPAETTRLRWGSRELLSTVYTYHPFLGKFR